VDSNWPAPGTRHSALHRHLAGGDRRRDRGRKQRPGEGAGPAGEGAPAAKARITLRWTTFPGGGCRVANERGCGEPAAALGADSVQLLGGGSPQPRVHVAGGEDRRTAVPKPSNSGPASVDAVVIAGPATTDWSPRPCWPTAGWDVLVLKLNPIPRRGAQRRTDTRLLSISTRGFIRCRWSPGHSRVASEETRLRWSHAPPSWNTRATGPTTTHRHLRVQHGQQNELARREAHGRR